MSTKAEIEAILKNDIAQLEALVWPTRFDQPDVFYAEGSG
ncbi:Uncharacterised protein [Brucella anthropi]|nr:Uncharacterised protein [Brucella anthropi]